MDAKIIELVGSVAGIGGLAIALCLFIFRDLLRKKIFPTLTKDHAFRVINNIILATTIVAIIGIIAWATLENKKNSDKDEKELSGKIDFYIMDDQEQSGLDIKVSNNSKQTLLVHNVTFNVKKSLIDPAPIIDFSHNGNFLKIKNLGWGRVNNPRIVLTSENIEAEAEKLEESMSLNSFDNEISVDLSPFIERNWVNEMWQQYLYETVERDEDYETGEPIYKINLNENTSSYHSSKIISAIKTENVQPLSDSDVANNFFILNQNDWEKVKKNVIGKKVSDNFSIMANMDFFGKNVKGEDIDGITSFQFNKSIVRVRPMTTSALMPSYSYDVELDADSQERPYQIEVPVSQSIKPGDVDRFKLSIAAIKSSLHFYKIDIKTNLGTYSFDNIKTYVYMPKNEFLKYKSNDIKKFGSTTSADSYKDFEQGLQQLE